MKIVVFDLDETLGYFTQFGIFLDCLQNFLHSNKNENNKNEDIEKLKLPQNDFNEILDLFPEFIRPNIINILHYLKHKKKTNCCNKLMIYTNNTGSREWAQKIQNYFETKINSKLIDQIIAAFKINGTQVEICRTTHDKTYNDLIRCAKIPTNAEICFIDDMFHPKMVDDNIYYINLKPYYYDLEFDDITQRFLKSAIGKRTVKNRYNDFETFMKTEVQKYNYTNIEKTNEEYEIDKILGKHILTHLQIFFNDKKRSHTRKYYLNRNNRNNKINKNKTRKI